MMRGACFNARLSEGSCCSTTWPWRTCTTGQTVTWEAASAWTVAVCRAVVELDDCGEELVACKREKPETKSEEFSQKITDRKSQEETIKTAVEATGGGWGVSLSTGVEHMSKHTSATTSVSFTLGKAKKVRNRYIDYTRTLKLAPEARAKLEQDPVEFLNFYGGYFVESIRDGGSFVGIATATSQSTASTESLGVFASLDFFGIFDAGFKTSFDNAKKQSRSSARVEVTSVSVGGQSETEGEEEEGNLTALNKKFEKWDSSVEASPVPLSMSLQPWITLGEVSDFLNKQNRSIVDLFNNGVSEEIVEALTTETWSIQSLRQDLQSLEARHTKIGCGTQSAQRVRAWEEEKQKLSDAVSAHFLALELLKLGDIMKLQTGIQRGNWSFFTASRDDGSLRKDMALLEAGCYAASTSYEGANRPTEMRPQHLKFQNSLLPESFDGTFLMMGMQLTAGGHCVKGEANALKSAQLLGQSVLDIEVKKLLPRSELVLRLDDPKTVSFGTCEAGTFVDSVRVGFDKLDGSCASDGSLIKTITLYCQGLPLGNYSAFETRASSVWRAVQNPRTTSIVDLSCDRHYLASSMKLTPSGSCMRHCDADGAVIYEMSLECTPLCNFNPQWNCPP